MVDFHTHILPGIDDGSDNAEISMQMLREEKKSGVDTVIFTPHFYADKDKISSFLKKRDEKYEQLMSIIRTSKESDRQLLEICYYVGAEVYYFSGIGEASAIQQLCIAGTKLLLLEMPFVQWTKAMYEDIRKLIYRQKLTVVLAHIERYVDFQKKKDVWREILELPVIIQMNAGPFTRWRSRSKALRIARDRGVILLGSDAHNMESRRPNLLEGRKVIEKELGTVFIKEQEQLEKQLLGGF